MAGTILPGTLPSPPAVVTPVLRTQHLRCSLTPAVLMTPLRSVPQRGPRCSRNSTTPLMEWDYTLHIDAVATSSAAALLAAARLMACGHPEGPVAHATLQLY